MSNRTTVLRPYVLFRDRTMLSANVLERFAELPANLSAHLRLTVIALTVGVVISVPLAIWLVKRPRFRYPMLTAAGVVQTIPSLALLALMVPVLALLAYLAGWVYLTITGQDVPEAARDVRLFSAFGFWPAIIALTMYSILPILRNTVTGILGVDQTLTEAARGVGMTERQVLWRVELPLAAPVIIAGIRTATVWVVGIATLATPVGQRCLGNYIFTGLQTQNWTMLMFGVVSAAVLAILLDLLIGGIQRAVENRSRSLVAVACSALLAVGLAGLFAPNIVAGFQSTDRFVMFEEDESEDRERQRVIHIGSKTFTEQYILAAMIEMILNDAGYETQRTDSLGSIIIFDMLAQGDLDLYVEYTGTVWANTMNRDDVRRPWRVYNEMSGWLAQTYGIRAFGTLGFENAYALVMRRDRAAELSINAISDLSEHAPELKIGGDYEYFGRPEWAQKRHTYGLNFADRISLDSTLMYDAVADGEVDVIAAFSTDGRIAAYDLVVIEDDRFVIPPYDAVMLMSSTIADREDIASVLWPLLDSIDEDLMQRANHKVDRDSDRYTVRQAANWLREQILEE